MMFRSYNNITEYFLKDYVAIAMARAILRRDNNLLFSRVKIYYSVKARIHGATLRAILRATSVTRRGYTVATFRATLRAILDQRLHHAIQNGVA